MIRKVIENACKLSCTAKTSHTTPNDDNSLARAPNSSSFCILDTLRNFYAAKIDVTSSHEPLKCETGKSSPPFVLGTSNCFLEVDAQIGISYPKAENAVTNVQIYCNM